MKEYIEREAAIAEIDAAFPAAPSSEFSRGVAVGVAMAKIAVCHLPAADVRPVVLCRDCLHYEMGACLKIYDDGAANKDAWQERKPEDFCSYGEKREES